MGVFLRLPYVANLSDRSHLDHSEWTDDVLSHASTTLSRLHHIRDQSPHCTLPLVAHILIPNIYDRYPPTFSSFSNFSSGPGFPSASANASSSGSSRKSGLCPSSSLLNFSPKPSHRGRGGFFRLSSSATPMSTPFSSQSHLAMPGPYARAPWLLHCTI
jgi:hypothetical protein